MLRVNLWNPDLDLFRLGFRTHSMYGIICKLDKYIITSFAQVFIIYLVYLQESEAFVNISLTCKSAKC